MLRNGAWLEKRKRGRAVSRNVIHRAQSENCGPTKFYTAWHPSYATFTLCGHNSQRAYVRAGKM